MNTLEANIRDTKTKGELNSLRDNGEVPAIIYGGKEENQKISLSKKQVQFLIEQENTDIVSIFIKFFCNNIINFKSFQIVNFLSQA